MRQRKTAQILVGVLAACCLALLATAWAPDRAAAGERGPRGYFVNVGTSDAPLRLWVEERGRGKPILLIHGLGANVYTWRKLVPDLARTHRVIAVDLKGFGRSDKPFDDAYGALDQAVLLKRLIVRRGLTDLTLIGHSLGGGVALALAYDLDRSRPGTVRRLVLMSSIAYRQQLPPSLALLQVPVLAQLGAFTMPAEIQVYQALHEAYYDASKITRDQVQAYARPLHEPAARYALLKTVEQIEPPNLSKVVARYPAIRQPALLIWCAEDQIVPLWVGRKLARDLPNSRLAVMRGCGHVPQEEAGARTLALVRRFID
jgi:pimeloyl-ACP methyl ester carboxylesterase